jgi:putative SOS response-associated peptidase YedK
MYGQFILHASGADVASHFGRDEIPDLFDRFNIAPTQAIPTVRLDDAGRHVLRLNKWGLIPVWAKDAKLAASLINVRAETVAEKPTFRSAFKSRRCLIPSSGFYEWRATGGKHKQPFHFRRIDFAFAGLWERWQDPAGGGNIETCAIITTAANGVVKQVHERMPVILDPADYGQWLDPQAVAMDWQLSCDLTLRTR